MESENAYKLLLNASLLRSVQNAAKMYRLNNNTDIFHRLNITEEHIKYLENMVETSSTTTCYHNNAIKKFSEIYKLYHGYASLIVCIFGIFANMLNIVVLTHKEMIVSPINKILTALAITDMLVMVEYIPFAVYTYFVQPEGQSFPYAGAVFILVHMHFTQIFHTTSIALTLTLAVWRYIAIRFPQYSNAWCTPARCTIALRTCVLAPFIACSPSYFVFGIKKQIIYENGTYKVLYHVDADYSQDRGFLYRLNFWILGVVVKLLPCLILTIISCWLIRTLCRTKERKEALKNYNQPLPKAKSIGNGMVLPGKPGKNEKRADRTTRMLVAVLFLFLVTESPQGVLGLLSGILGDCFFRNYYHKLGDVMDILALLNGAINFILYCSMSRQFRTTFGQLFKQRIMKKWHPTQKTDVQSTYV